MDILIDLAASLFGEAQVQPREPRQTVSVTARMKTSQGWQDVAIRNVSPHGLRICLAEPITRGAYFEVRRATQVIVARAMWVDGNECGARTQDVIDIPALINPSAARTERVIGEAQAERRTVPRPDESAARAHHIVQKICFAAAGAALLLVSGYAAMTVGDTLGRPFQQVNRALAGETGD